MKSHKKIIDGSIFILLSVILLSRILITEENLRSRIAEICIALILIILHVFMPQFVKLEPDSPKVKTMRRYNILTGIIIISLFTVHNFLPQTSFANNDKVLLLFLVVVVILIGNAAPKLPINGVIGIRLPWTMRDQETWRIAHRVLGYCSFPVAVIMIAGGLLINPVFFSIGGVIVCMLIPSIYSFIYYCKK